MFVSIKSPEVGPVHVTVVLSGSSRFSRMSSHIKLSFSTVTGPRTFLQAAKNDK